MQEIVGIKEHSLSGPFTKLYVIPKVLPLFQYKFFKFTGLPLAITKSNVLRPKKAERALGKAFQQRQHCNIA